MRRLVLDPSVLVSALIADDGPPAQLLKRAREGDFEIVLSPLVLEELERVLRRPKFRRYCDLEGVLSYIDHLRRDALIASDPSAPPPFRCADPEDDYLIALAFHQNAILVSGDKHLLEKVGGAPILAPADLAFQQE